MECCVLLIYVNVADVVWRPLLAADAQFYVLWSFLQLLYCKRTIQFITALVTLTWWYLSIALAGL